MNQPLLKISGSVCLMFLLHASGFAQEEANTENDTDKGNRYDEIIIRHKGNKDAKVTVEIKDGQVLVDGKPVSDFEDSTISIHKRKIRRNDATTFSFSGPDGTDLLSPGNFDVQPMVALSPFRNGGGWGYSGDDIHPNSNRSFLGVTSEKPSDGEGARVMQVSKGSAAEKSGLRPGDVITKVDDADVTDPQSLTDAVRQHQPGDKIAITFSRDGKVQQDSVVLGKTRTGQAYSYGYGAPDLRQLQQLRDLRQLQQLPEMPREFNLTFNNSLKFGIRAQDTEDGKGVKVLDVDDESTAAKAGIKEGDIITRFDGKEINSATALTEAASAAREKASVKVSLIRDGKTQEIEVRVPKRLRTADL
jgi:serine protease Do